MKTLVPVNQKSVYHSAGDLYAKIVNDEISIEKAEQANAALSNMNRTYALEIKRTELERQLKGASERVEIRVVETKNFDQIPLEEKNGEKTD
jgi:hypothetical protein